MAIERIRNGCTMAIEVSLCNEVIHRRRRSHTLLKVDAMSSSPQFPKQLAWCPGSTLQTTIPVEESLLSLIVEYRERELRSADCNQHASNER